MRFIAFNLRIAKTFCEMLSKTLHSVFKDNCRFFIVKPPASSTMKVTHIAGNIRRSSTRYIIEKIRSIKNNHRLFVFFSRMKRQFNFLFKFREFGFKNLIEVDDISGDIIDNFTGSSVGFHSKNCTTPNVRFTIHFDSLGNQRNNLFGHHLFSSEERQRRFKNNFMA